jgi:hypothetical protein
MLSLMTRFVNDSAKCKSAIKMLCALAGITTDGQLQAICLWNFSNIQNTAIVVSNVM